MSAASDYRRGWSDACQAVSAAVSDLKERHHARKPLARERPRMLDPEAVERLMRDRRDDRQECFWTLSLDVRGRLLDRHQVAQGAVSQCPVSPRDALAPAVRDQAHGVIFVHNHPSGDPSPSPEDADLTARLRAAAEVLGIVARDHVIVGSEGRFSFVEAGRWRR